MQSASQVPHFLVALSLIGMTTGCVRRTIMITSDPEGALVYLNHKEIGRTPVEVDFLYYGGYDVRLVKEGYEPIIARGDGAAPLWDVPPFDLVAEAIPGETRSELHWHYQLSPVSEDQPALLDNAEALRAQLAGEIEASGIEISVPDSETAAGDASSAAEKPQSAANGPADDGNNP